MPEITPKLSKQHPVPQHIAAFEFKLIGDLTIKQFLFAGVGVAVAYAAWVSNLNFLLKWGIIIAAAGIGLGTAFFPLQDRTLDQWLLNFIAAIFSPTQRVWRKEPLPPEYLREDYSQFLTSQVLSMTPLQSRRRLRQYLKGFEGKRSESEVAEQEFIKRLNFDLPLPTTVEPEPVVEPAIEPKKEELPPRQEVPAQPKLASEVNLAFEPTYKVPTEAETKYITVRRNITPGRKIRLPTIEGTIRLRPEPMPLAERKISPPSFAPRATEGLRPKPREPIRELIKDSVKTPPPENGRVERLQKQNLELQTRLEQAERQLKGLTATKPKPSPPPEPRPPTPVIDKKIPNIISGVVKDKEGKLLENTVVIIKDQDGDPVRALKTDRLGQFAISTSLENGDYTIEVSSKERHFDIMKVTADGSILSALELRERYG